MTDGNAMNRRYHFVSNSFEKGTTWVALLAFLTSQASLVSGFLLMISLMIPDSAQAARLGTSTVSAGSAPPPAATTVDSFQPDLFTGRASSGIPIAVPPGRRGVQPSLGIGYSSSSRNGWLGVGWSLDLGYIERSTRKGVPRYDASDSYALLFQNVSSELVQLADTTYRAKDEGAFLRIDTRGDSGWEVRDKSGTRYLFGQTANSRIANGSRIFRWSLDQVMDVNGNSMLLNYTNVDGLTYLSSISYTGHQPSGLAPANRVDFILEARPDVESGFRSGFLLTTSRRLAAIEARATYNGDLSLARRYELKYRLSQRTGRSLLVSVQQFGTDGSTSLPPVAFDWQDSPPPNYSRISNQRDTGQVAWNVRGASYDCGHDNYGCIHPYGGGPCGPAGYGSPVVVKGGTSQEAFGVRIEVGTSGSFRVTGSLLDRQIHAWTAVFLQTARSISLPQAGGWDVACLWIEDADGVHGPFRGGGDHRLSAGWSLIHLLAYNQNDGRTDGFGIEGSLASQVDVMNPTVLTEPQLAGDVDGNGITDIIDFQAAAGNWSAYCSQVCTLSPGASWLTNFGDNNSLPILGDWNGDGRTDVAVYNTGNWRFATSSGTAFVRDALPEVNFASGSPLTGDFNGDGVMDLGTYDRGTWRFALGRGSNFVATSSFDFVSGTSSSQHLTGDFNGDGLTDIAVIESNQLTLGLCDGVTFRAQPPVSLSEVPTAGVQSADFNGDGLSDLAYYERATGRILVAFNGNGRFAAPIDLSSSLRFSQRTDQDQVQVADFNGDSIPDPALFNATTGDSELSVSRGGAPDLLTGISNGVGGHTAIAYTPASALGNHFLPFLAPLVTETRISDGLGNSYTNRITYSQGLYDAASKEFRGFGRVEIRDTEGNVSVTRFHQDNLLKGRPYLAEFRDGSDHLFTRTTNHWEAVQPYPGTEASFVRLIQVDNFTFDGTETFRQTRSRSLYDQHGNVTSSYADGEVSVSGDERSSTTTFTLNTNAWILNRPALTQSFDAVGNVVSLRRFYYDGAPDASFSPTKGNLTREEEWLDRDRNGPVGRWIASTMDYDLYGNVLRVTDALNHSVTNSYDSVCQTYVVQVSNPLGHSRAIVYDPRFGHVIASTDQNGVKSSSEYDALGRVTKVIGPLDTPALPTIRYEYELTSNPVRVSQYTRVLSGQQKELVSHAFSDGLGRSIQTRSPAQDPTKQIVGGAVEFDSKGRVVRQWTPYLDSTSTSYRPHTLSEISSLLAPPVVHFYDPLGRLLTTTDPDGSSTSVEYAHWTVTTSDAKHQLRRRSSDAFGRLVQVQEFEGGGTNATLYATTTYQYDSRDNLVLLRDAVGNSTTLHYDSLGRKIRMVDPDMGTWTYGYDDLDQLVSQTDARGVSIRFTYDELNRQTRKDYEIPPNINVPTNQPSVIYGYDNPLKSFSKGKLTEIVDASGSSGFVYDTLGRLTAEAKIIDDVTYTIQREYDLLGRLTVLTYPNSDRATYTYNDQGGIQTITLQSPGAAVQPIINSMSYNAAGQITKMVYGNGVVTDYSYNPQTLRLDNLKSVGPSGVLQDFTYSFDPVGNVTAIVDAVHTASQTFTYDSLNRLATAKGASYGSFTYSYDQIGNMVNKESVTQMYGELNKRPHAVTSTSSGLQLTYDANGNIASKGSRDRPNQVFVFDGENRLVEVGSPSPHRKLEPGWNFVSFPQVRGEVWVSELITNFTGSYEQLTRFNTRSNWFESFVNLPGTNQFDTVNATNGYALYVTNSAGTYLPLGETPAPIGPRLLPAGTNFLAGPPDIMSATNWLSGLVPGLDYDQVLGLNPNTSATEPVTAVRPGEAYYVRMLRPANWTPPTAARIANPSTVRFVYDGDGGRVKKITWKGTTLFLGSSYEVSEDGQTIAYVFAGGQRLAAKESDGSLRIYHSDHLASPNAVSDQTGATVEFSENTPYGSISRKEGTVKVAHRFTGQRLDEETGIYFFGARYYDPEIGRFAQADTIVPSPGNPQDLNRYSYARNNPIIFVDPSGHSWRSAWQNFAGGFVGALVTAITAPILGPFSALLGGAAGGATTGGLQGGGRGAGEGAWRGAASSFVLGRIGQLNPGLTLTAGAAWSYYSGGPEGLGDFAAGLAGGLAGSSVGQSNSGQGRASSQEVNRASAASPDNSDISVTRIKVSLSGMSDSELMNVLNDIRTTTQQKAALLEASTKSPAYRKPAGLEWWHGYLLEVESVMSGPGKFLIGQNSLLGPIGGVASDISNVGYIPKGIGYKNSNFLEGGRIAYRWANQHGSGYGFYDTAKIGVGSAALNVAGAALTAYTIGEVIDSYWYGYIRYQSKLNANAAAANSGGGP
jgi:RHS repeat-associated protein